MQFLSWVLCRVWLLHPQCKPVSLRLSYASWDGWCPSLTSTSPIQTCFCLSISCSSWVGWCRSLTTTSPMQTSPAFKLLAMSLSSSPHLSGIQHCMKIFPSWICRQIFTSRWSQWDLTPRQTPCLVEWLHFQADPLWSAAWGSEENMERKTQSDGVVLIAVQINMRLFDASRLFGVYMCIQDVIWNKVGVLLGNN